MTSFETRNTISFLAAVSLLAASEVESLPQLDCDSIYHDSFRAASLPEDFLVDSIKDSVPGRLSRGARVYGSPRLDSILRARDGARVFITGRRKRGAQFTFRNAEYVYENVEEVYRVSVPPASRVAFVRARDVLVENERLDSGSKGPAIWRSVATHCSPDEPSGTVAPADFLFLFGNDKPAPQLVGWGRLLDCDEASGRCLFQRAMPEGQYEGAPDVNGFSGFIHAIHDSVVAAPKASQSVKGSGQWFAVLLGVGFEPIDCARKLFANRTVKVEPVFCGFLEKLDLV